MLEPDPFKRFDFINLKAKLFEHKQFFSTFDFEPFNN